ncbi:MAG TPA: ATP-dependent DNA ligase [Gemmatimonadaceae bacterium]|nr:ATP-dependent DNA ligase [Gemmatimonadaceae bacterium]
MTFHDLVLTSNAVAATSSRLKKIDLLAGLLRGVSPNDVPIAIGFLTGWPRQGKLGVGWAMLESSRPSGAASVPELTIADVDQAFAELQAVRGKQSGAERRRLLTELMARSTAEEQRFLYALIVGEVRHGALDGVMTEAVARAANLSSDRVRRAAMLAGDLAAVAQAVLVEGEAGLAHWSLQLFRPVQPMLADSAPDVVAALEQLGRASLEWKLDGARIQVHRQGDRVSVYTRSLNEVTGAVPEVVEAVLAFPARELILDGEVIALDRDERPLPFQVTMRRFGRKLDVEALRADLPVQPFFFDVMHLDGDDLLDHSFIDRLARLEAVVPPAMRVPRIITADPNEARQFEAGVLERGHEGLMAKSLVAPYAAGRRGSAWLKVKTARTLDLVVIGVEWGSGRRQGWLSNLHLGARDPATGGFVMLGKTFKGMTDEILEWQTKELLARQTHRDGHIVYVRPELVVEVAFSDVQRSPQYPGGVALRFARIKGYRPDKRPEDADTIEAVVRLAPLER